MEMEQVPYYEEIKITGGDFKAENPEPKATTEHFKILEAAGERVMIEFGITELILKIREQNYQTLFFMDKSGRPFAWILKKAWSQLYPKEKSPEIKFINRPDNFRTVTDGDLEVFRSVFHNQVKGKVCLVDELSLSGSTYDNAEALIRSLPKQKDSVIDRFDVMQIFPSWYGEWSEEYTGVREKQLLPSPTGRSFNQHGERATVGQPTFISDKSQVAERQKKTAC